jgi:transposase InsO family protein
MSRKADCYDNAPMESFFRSLKPNSSNTGNMQWAEATRGILSMSKASIPFVPNTELRGQLRELPMPAGGSVIAGVAA